MNAPSVDIKDMIETAVLGTYATDLFISKQPTTPDICTTIFDTTGGDPYPKFSYEFPGIQVLLRGEGAGYIALYARARAMRDALTGNTNTIVNSTKYVGIFAQGDILFLGYDDNDRPMLSFNLRIQRSE